MTFHWGSKTPNHSYQAISGELTIQTDKIRENTLYLHDEKYLSPLQTSFVVIFYVKIRKNATICTKLTFQRVQKQNHSKQAISSELTILTYQISENTLYLVDKKNLRPLQTYFVVICHDKIRKNVTISIHFKILLKPLKVTKYLSKINILGGSG